jgi:TPR repeat protein
MAYHAGNRGVPEDLNLAFKWYSSAAQKGHISATAALGHMYQQGLGVGKNVPEALKWYLKAAEQGDSHAAYELGMMYNFGHGVLIDYVEAYAWFLAAGREDFGRAKELRVKMTDDHVSRAESRFENILRGISKVTLKKAEEGGSAEKLRHGMILLSLREYPSAMKWFLVLARKGNPEAQRMVGIMYLNGLGVEINYNNYAEAYAWFNLALAGGDNGSREQIEQLSTKMSPELIVQGQARSKDLLMQIDVTGSLKK